MAGIIDAIFNPIFGWLLNIPPILAILILSLILGIISTLLQKYLTDQAKMRRIRDDVKKFQKQYKELARKNPEKALALQQKMLPLQMDMMKESFKPLLVTLIPFLAVFFWLGMHFAYHPIEPDQPFTVTATFEEGVGGVATLHAPGLRVEEAQRPISEGAATWTLSGPAGEHTLTMEFAGANYTREVLITTEREFIQPEKPLGGTVQEFNVGNRKLLPLGQGFNLFGWRPGWIFYYILFSIPISLGLKKLFNVV